MSFASYQRLHYRPDVLRGFDETSSPLSTVFFSDENVELVNKKLVLEVYKQTGVKIPFQGVERLVIAMRYIHSTYAKHLPTDIRGQVAELDELVVKHILPDVINSVEQIIEYQKVVDGKREFLDTPINVSRRAIDPSDLPADRQIPECVSFSDRDQLM
jgi:hypothetical protein